MRCCNIVGVFDCLRSPSLILRAMGLCSESNKFVTSAYCKHSIGTPNVTCTPQRTELPAMARPSYEVNLISGLNVGVFFTSTDGGRPPLFSSPSRLRIVLESSG